MSDQTCPDCVKLFKVHRPTNWARCVVTASALLMVAVISLLSKPNATTLHLAPLSIVCFLSSVLTAVSYVVFYFIRCSRFLISVDSAGLVHLHKRDEPVLGAQLVLEVAAGAIRRKCKLHCASTNNWKITANNEYIFFTDPDGEMLSVSYCAQAHYAATGYIPNPKKHISDALRLIKQVGYVAAIGRLALDHVNAETQDEPCVAGSISATQG